MPSLDTTSAFFVIALVLGFTPGPDNLFVLMQAASQGRKAGVFVVLGLCTGLLVHTAAVALGLAAVFAASAMAFTVLKFAGAAYLAYLAWQAWRAPAAGVAGVGAPAVAPGRLFLRGIVMNLTNPKVVLFFLAFLPQFVDTARGPVALQVLTLGAVFILATLLAFGLITYLAGTLGQWLRRSPGVQTGMNRATAVVFAGLALRLATSAR